MSVFVFIRFFLECVAVGLVCYAIYREKDLIRFERKIWKYSKAFFKAAYFSLRDKFVAEPKVEDVTPLVNAEFEEMKPKYLTDEILDNAVKFSDTAIIVISRTSAEGTDHTV